MSAVTEAPRGGVGAALKLGSALLAGVLVAAAVGWFFLVRPGDGVEGEIHYSGDDASSMHLGPGGWFIHSDGDGGTVVEHVSEDRSWPGPRHGSIAALTSEGTAVSVLGGGLLINGEDGEVETESQDVLAAHGDKSLQPGESAEVIGLSETHVAVASCLSEDGEARLTGDEGGGTLVVSGVALEDGSVTWSHDPEVDCAADLATTYPTALPEQEYVLLTPSEEEAQALDLDTGEVAETWSQAPRGRVLVQGDLALHRAGDEVTVTSLRSGKAVADVSCPGARLDNPGHTGGRLAEEATPLVRCGSSVRLFDGRAFVEVDAPPVGESQQVADGSSVVHDRFVIERDGDRLTFTDGLSDKEIGQVDVPEDFRIATNDVRGRLVVFFESGDNWRTGTPETEFRVVDGSTASLVAESDDDLSPGADVSPDGYAVLSELVERTRGRSSTTRVWVVGVPSS